KSPNRKVGDCSFLPTTEAAPGSLSNPPTGRLGIVHSCLQRGRPRFPLKSPNRKVGDDSFQPTQRPPAVPSQIPQPEGWGLFIPAYNRGRSRFPLKSPNREVGDCSFLPTTEAACGSLSNPPTGRLGIVHSCLQQRPPAVPSQ